MSSCRLSGTALPLHCCCLSLRRQADIELLRRELPALRPECLRVLEVSTLLLQRCAAAGLTLSDIGGLMSRPLDCLDAAGCEGSPSELEKACVAARQVGCRRGWGPAAQLFVGRCNTYQQCTACRVVCAIRCIGMMKGKLHPLMTHGLVHRLLHTHQHGSWLPLPLLSGDGDPPAGGADERLQLQQRVHPGPA